MKREDGALEFAWPNGEEDRLHIREHDGVSYVERVRWLKVRGELKAAPRGERMPVDALRTLLAPSPAPTETAANVFVTGKHPTCPSCESLVLPDGKCVNGCAPTETVGRLRWDEKLGAVLETHGISSVVDRWLCLDALEAAGLSRSTPPRDPVAEVLAVPCPMGCAPSGKACSWAGDDRYDDEPRICASRIRAALTRRP